VVTSSEIPEQKRLSWPIVGAVSVAGLRRRFVRAMITMVGVVLAIAFLAYMLVSETLIKAMIAAGDAELNVLLQNMGVDIFSGGKTDQMTYLLIGLTLLTSLVGIVNAMLMAVTERVKEIGTLKCLGATDSFIVRAYFLESTIQGVCGAAAGALIGLIVAVAVSIKGYGIYPLKLFPAVSVLGALVVSLIAGAVLSVMASILPAYAAARKQPVEALRVEE
jgi:ABC-type antimicrobial peptide transport system permease subunit